LSEIIDPPNVSPAYPAIRALLHRLGIDRAVGTTVGTRIGQAASTLVLMALVAGKLSPVQQGYYVTFNSVAAAQVFFELGLTYVLLQFASHEVSRLIAGADGRFEGESAAKARLASLLRFGVRWYLSAASLLWLLVLPGGYWFFLSASHGPVAEGWQIPWFVLVIATGATLLTNSIIAIFEGCGQVAEVASLRLRETLLGAVVAATILMSGGGLYAVPALVVVDALCEAFWLWRRRVSALDLWRSYDAHSVVSWRTEVWPFQWKIAVSWLSGYFIYQIFNPILFSQRGAVEAGQMGITVTACTGIMWLSMAWITTKAPRMGSLVALGERQELDSLFFSAAKRAIALTVVLGFGFWALVAFAQSRHVGIAMRFTDPVTLGLMLLSATFNCVWFAEATYLRAHKVEPFLGLSVAAAIANLVGALVLARPYGAEGVALSFALVTLVIGVGGGTYVFNRKRAEWSL